MTLDPCRASATNYQEVQEKVALETSQCEKVALRSATAITEMVKIMWLILSKKGANAEHRCLLSILMHLPKEPFVFWMVLCS